MDPDENWKKQLEICRALSTTSLSGLSPDDSSDMVVELVACMVALDAWIAGGGVSTVRSVLEPRRIRRRL